MHSFRARVVRENKPIRSVESLALALLFSGFVVASGVPALRQDWWWPRTSEAMSTLYEAYAGGWFPFGIGSPNQYPQKYLIAEVIAVLFYTIGSLPALFVTISAFALTLCHATGRLLGNGAGALQRVPLQVIALFNPWVYNEVVAGHMFLIASFAALVALVVEMRRERPRPALLGLIFALAMVQLQFAVIAGFALAVYALRNRMLQPLVTMLVLSGPTIVGVLFGYSALAATPQNLAWLAGQSVAPLDIALMRGYFVGYDAKFTGIFLAGPTSLAIVGLVGAVRGRKLVEVRLALLSLVAVGLCASGTKGPLASLFDPALRYLPQIGLFRELYDLVAISIVATMLLAARGLERMNRYLRLGFAACALVTLSYWVIFPPASFWVNADALPALRPSLSPGDRYALVPAFQPLRFDGRGLGADPDTIDYGLGRSSVNEVFPSYPIDAAFGSFEQSGETRDLASLGVARIVGRPWLASGEIQTDRSRPPFQRAFPAMPVVSIVAEGTLCALCRDLDGGNVFFGDRGFHIDPITTPLTYDDPKLGWIDARIIFKRWPDVAQAFGGAATESEATLPIREGEPILASVRGRLESEGGILLATGDGKYAFITIPPSVRHVRCRGKCVIAYQTGFTVAPLDAPQRVSHGLFARHVFPWLVSVAVPSLDAAEVLRFRDRYDRAWVGFDNRHVYEHLRIDAIFNGWSLPPSRTGSTMYLLHVVSGLQFLLEIVGSLWVVFLIAIGFRVR